MQHASLSSFGNFYPNGLVLFCIYYWMIISVANVHLLVFLLLCMNRCTTSEGHLLSNGLIVQRYCSSIRGAYSGKWL